MILICQVDRFSHWRTLFTTKQKKRGDAKICVGRPRSAILPVNHELSETISVAHGIAK